MGVAHGEGLAGQHAPSHQAGEELILADGRQQEAQAVRLRGQRAQGVVAVDVVDLPGVSGEPLVQEVLQQGSRPPAVSRVSTPLSPPQYQGSGQPPGAQIASRAAASRAVGSVCFTMR